MALFVNKQQFMSAAHSNGGWIDAEGHVIHKTNYNNGNDYCFYIDGDYALHKISMEELRKKKCITIPRVFTGYEELVFLKKWRCQLSQKLEEYGLVDYIEDVYPPFFDEKISTRIRERGLSVFSITLRMLEENDDIAELYQQFPIEGAIFKEWCLKNEITLI